VDFIEAKDDGVGADNWSYRTCCAVKSSPPANQHPNISQAGCPSCCPANSVKNAEWRLVTIIIITSVVK